MEKISALLDGELDSPECTDLLQAIPTQTEAKRCWQEYCLISDALHQKTHLRSDTQFCQKVMLAIQADQGKPLHVSISPQASNTPRLHWKPWVSVAAAAAGVFFATGIWLHGAHPSSPASPLQQAQNHPPFHLVSASPTACSTPIYRLTSRSLVPNDETIFARQTQLSALLPGTLSSLTQGSSTYVTP